MDVVVMVCRRSGLLLFQSFAVLTVAVSVRLEWMSPLWFVAVSAVAVSVRLKWMSPLWFVAVPVCRRFDCRRFGCRRFDCTPLNL